MVTNNKLKISYRYDAKERKKISLNPLVHFDIKVELEGTKKGAMITHSVLHDEDIKSKDQLDWLRSDIGIFELGMIKEILCLETSGFTKQLPHEDLSVLLRPYRYSLQETIALNAIISLRDDWVNFRNNGEEWIHRNGYYFETKNFNHKEPANDSYNLIENMFGFGDFFPLLKPQKKWKVNRGTSEYERIRKEIVNEQITAKKEALLNNPLTFYITFRNSLKGCLSMGYDKRTIVIKRKLNNTDKLIELINDIDESDFCRKITNNMWNWYEGDLFTSYKKYFEQLNEEHIDERNAFEVFHEALIPTQINGGITFRKHVLDKKSTNSL